MDQISVPVPTLKEVIESGNELISEVSQHPALSSHDDKKTAMIDTSIISSNNEDQLDLIERANKHLSNIDDCIKNINKSVRAVYSHRFPELEITDPMQYIVTVQLLGNRPEKIADEKIKIQLAEVLDPKLLLLTSMTASTTQGIKVESDEMDKVLRACAVAIHLANLKNKLLSFVEENMNLIAPNLSAILGAPIAAKLMGRAGSLKNLAYSHPNKFRSLGYECDLIQSIPFDHTKDVRKNAIKWVVCKCSLAARIDFAKSHPDGSEGRKLRDSIESKINKELEPPPKKAARPLPVPREKSGKKRGGRRVRRMKERYAQTELRRALNRVAFGDVGDDAYQDDLGFDRTQLKAIGKLRGPQVNQKTKIRLSKSAQKKLAKGQQNEQKSGDTQKSIDTKDERLCITLKPDQQEMKIFNPSARESCTAGTSGETSNYFSNTAGFFAIKRDDKT